MNAFNEYAKVYDLFYEAKDYKAEVSYVNQLIKKNNLSPKHILDLGCGTGTHAAFFSEYGYQVCGVDSSQKMIDIAQSKNQNNALEFLTGDARSIRLQKKFDVVISLFHVMNYQIFDEDLLNIFHTAREHLHPGGLFIFDFWYGPAVLADQPQARVKKIVKDTTTAIKIAQPEIKPNENRVDIHFTVILQNQQGNKLQEIQELHQMRYLFMPELRALLKNMRFKLKNALQWMQLEQELNLNSWLGVIVAEAQ